MTEKIIPLYGYGVYEFYWGCAVKEERTKKWVAVLLRPDGQKISLDGIDAEIHENGIEFLDRPVLYGDNVIPFNSKKGNQ